MQLFFYFLCPYLEKTYDEVVINNATFTSVEPLFPLMNVSSFTNLSFLPSHGGGHFKAVYSVRPRSATTCHVVVMDYGNDGR